MVRGVLYLTVIVGQPHLNNQYKHTTGEIMELKKLIEMLEKENPNKILKNGFTSPHSYRGDYQDLAFEPAQNIRVGDMLRDAKESKKAGKVFEGYKGGDFVMEDYTDCWLAEYGCCGETLGELLLNYMLNDEV